MVNKKGYLRILEAIIAVVLLFGVVLLVLSRQQEVSTGVPSNVLESQRIILERISYDKDLRNCIINAADGKCDVLCATSAAIISEDLLPGYNYACEICSKSLSCTDLPLPTDKSVFTNTIFFAGDGTNEKVVRLYFWR